MKLSISLYFLLFWVQFVPAQELLSPQQEVKAKLLTSFNFKQYNGGVITINCRINDLPDTLHFVLDTGSGGISLDSTTCSVLGIVNNPSDTTITGLGGTHKVNFAYNQTLHMPGLEIKNLNFHINDYDLLSSVYGEKIDGIIGYSFFSRYIVKLNYDLHKIEIYSPGKIDYPNSGYLSRPIFTSIPIETMIVKDARKLPFNFYFDTGAGLCLLLSENFIQDSSFLSKKRKPVVTQAEGLGGKLQMRLSVIKHVKFGKYRFRKVPTYLYKDDYNVTSYPFVGGLVGNDLLRRFNMIINYPKKEIHFLPNKSFSEPFDYAYSGLAIYFVDGEVRVEDIIDNSPADVAGLQLGDVIVGVNNNFSNNIQAYKTALQNVNQKVKLIIRRNDKLEELYIKPISILK